MAAWENDIVMDAALDVVATADKQTACTAQPTTYAEAVDPAAWVASTAYSLTDVARPTTRNGYAYEVTTAGTTGSTEPTWPTTVGNTVTDGTVVWTCRNNYAISDNAALTTGDFTKANGDTSGRKVTCAQKASINIHTAGTATHVAKVDDANKQLLNVNTCTSKTFAVNDSVTFPAHDVVEIGDVA